MLRAGIILALSIVMIRTPTPFELSFRDDLKAPRIKRGLLLNEKVIDLLESKADFDSYDSSDSISESNGCASAVFLELKIGAIVMMAMPKTMSVAPIACRTVSCSPKMR